MPQSYAALYGYSKPVNLLNTYFYLTMFCLTGFWCDLEIILVIEYALTTNDLQLFQKSQWDFEISETDFVSYVDISEMNLFGCLTTHC